MKKPLVSVIIPNYNHSLFLSDRINSVLNQDYKIFELIILDDCSTDNSKEIIERFRSNPYISHIIYNTTNTGNTFIQWDRGIRLAKGKYIWIAESDDLAELSFLSTLIPLLEANPTAVVAFSHSWTIDEKGKRLDQDWHKVTKEGEIRKYDGHHFCLRKLMIGNYIYNASMVVFLRSKFFEIDNGYQKYRFCGDWAFWMRMCLLGDVIEISIHLSSFRQHPNKVSEKGALSDNTIKDTAAIVNEFVPLVGLNSFQQKAYRGFWTIFIKRRHIINKTTLIKQYPKIFGGNTVDFACYYLNKIANKIFYMTYTKKVTILSKSSCFL